MWMNHNFHVCWTCFANQVTFCRYQFSVSAIAPVMLLDERSYKGSIIWTYDWTIWTLQYRFRTFAEILTGTKKIWNPTSDDSQHLGFTSMRMRPEERLSCTVQNFQGSTSEVGKWNAVQYTWDFLFADLFADSWRQKEPNSRIHE